VSFCPLTWRVHHNFSDNGYSGHTMLLYFSVADWENTTTFPIMVTQGIHDALLPWTKEL
jgi:hypothetical protein